MIQKYKIVFWDFDGVIKDSVPVKTKAYLELFPSSPAVVIEKIKEHHVKFGGVSRMKKIPLYLDWASLPSDEVTINNYILKFANLVVKAVVNSPWVPGAQEILDSKQKNQIFVLVTGTPQEEIEIILEKLKLEKQFEFIYGSPTEKKSVIETVIKKMKILPKECLMIGDSLTDFEAAASMGIDFILRTEGLDSFSKSFDGIKIKDFKEFI